MHKKEIIFLVEKQDYLITVQTLSELDKTE